MKLYKKLKAAIPANVAEIRPEYSHKVKPSDAALVTSSRHAYDVLKPFFELPDLREEFKIILLNRANKVLGVVNVGVGAQTSCVFDLPLCVALACTCRATGVILAHNHPSGRIQPSEADKAMTRKAKEALKLVDIDVLDHVILCEDSYFSFADEGLL